MKLRGMTLIELLIVLTILMLVVASSLPLLSTALAGRKQREAARLLTTYLSAARSRAMTIGRPAGVRLERFGNGHFALTVSSIEVPPPYSGEWVDATCRMTWTGTNGEYTSCRAFFDEVPGSFSSLNVSVGDMIRINQQGPLYQVVGPDTSPQDGVVEGEKIDLVVRLAGAVIPWARNAQQWRDASGPYPYQIFRRPAPSATPALTLPDEAAIDLHFSGSGIDSIFHALPPEGTIYQQPIDILFGPGGELSGVAAFGNPPLPAIETVYLLVGKTEKVQRANSPGITDYTDPEQVNIADPENMWVAITPTSGQITSAEVLRPPVPLPPGPGQPWEKAIRASRRLAQEALQIGGR